MYIRIHVHIGLTYLLHYMMSDSRMSVNVFRTSFLAQLVLFVDVTLSLVVI